MISNLNHLQPAERQAWRFGLMLSLLLAISWARAWGGEAYSLKPTQPRGSAHFPQSLVNALSPQGFRVYGKINGLETLICEIFWARDIAAQEATPASTNLFYGSLKPGTLVGVIHFLIIERYVRDYRSQILRPGYYTMRYAAMPEGANGSELDFVLLSAVTADQKPEQVPARDELVRRARLASRTRRPLMMSLAEIDKDQPFPSLTTDEEGTSVLQIKLHVKPAKSTRPGPPREFPLALTVVTSIPEDLGD
ncbi:MAG: hypothetical protein WCA49_15520 [Candidatus Sulfotelmatobacter sp.]